MSIRVDCSGCGRAFEVPRTLRGGLSNCPECHRAVPVHGGPEALFWVLVVLGIIGLAGVTGVTVTAAGWQTALVVGAVGSVVLVVLVLCQ